MNRKQGLVPIEEVFGGLNGPVKAIREASPQARHHFTQADQVDQLVWASEQDPEMGFMARMMALCSLPRTNPGNQHQYKRQNGPYKLIMVAGGDNKLPFGNLPAPAAGLGLNRSGAYPKPRAWSWVRSLSEFMRKLGILSSDQRRQLAGATAPGSATRWTGSLAPQSQLIYEEDGVKASSVPWWLTEPSSGGTRSGPTSPRCGRARSSWARSSSRRSSSTRCRWT